MATDLSGVNALPTTATESVGTSYVTLTVGAQISQVDVYFETNTGFFSYEAGAPAVHSPVPADTWFVLWVRPQNSSQMDATIQVKAGGAGTNVFYRAS